MLPTFAPHRCRSTLIRLLRLGLTLTLYCSATQADTVFFYNSESSVDNFASLKSRFDSYLSQQGNFTFQPFSERNVFEQALNNTPEGVYLISGWHYSQLSNKLALQPILVGSQKGALTQRKVLSTQEINDIESLKGITIAGAGSEDYLRNLARQMLGHEHDNITDSLRFLSVPKDIDALMAVSFGMAKASISSESSLSKLAIINSAQHAKFKTLAASDKNFLMIAVINRKKETEEKNLLKTIEDMPQSPDGEKNLNMLGLDGWKKISDLDVSISKQLR